MTQTMIALLLLGTLPVCFTALAQTQGQSAIRQMPDSVTVPMADSSSPVTVILTNVPFNGVNYFIKIVPIDTPFVDRMPMVNPRRDRSIIWRDSLQRLLPDTLLKFLPKKENLEKRPGQ